MFSKLILPAVALLLLFPVFTNADQSGTTEVVERRTWNTKIFRNHDGSFTATISTGPLHYHDGTGWRDIDESWRNEDGVWLNDRNSITSRLPVESAGECEVLHADSSIRWRPSGLVVFSDDGVTDSRTAPTSVKAAVEGNFCNYAGVYPGVDERYTALPGKLKHETVLHTPVTGSGDWFGLEYDYAGVQPQVESGLLVLGELTADPVFAVDASGHRSRVDGRYRVNGSRVSIEIPMAWLNDPSRQYPVVIDPTLGPDVSTQDTLIGSSFAAMSTYTEQEIYVQDDGTDEERSLVQFDTSALPAGAVIDSATMNFRVTTVTIAGSGAIDVSVHRLLRTWGAGTTWNSADGTNAWGTAGAKAVTDTDATAIDTKSVAGTVGTSVSFDVTSVVAQWAGGTANNGVLLRANTASATFNDRGFGSKEHATAANRPTLTVNYNGTTGGNPPTGSTSSGGGGGGGCVAVKPESAGWVALLVFALLAVRTRRRVS